jgi:hypothetical protein
MSVLVIDCARNPNRANSSRNIRLISLSEWEWDPPFERDSEEARVGEWRIEEIRNSKSSRGGGEVTVWLWLWLLWEAVEPGTSSSGGKFG